jgi:hypothetical protein
LWPHERSLVKKLEGRPFALIGINVNPYDPNKLKDVMDKEKLNWRSFANGDVITPQWNLRGTPTLYVLDHKGVIRHKWMGSPGEPLLDAALEKLIQDVERNGKDTGK